MEEIKVKKNRKGLYTFLIRWWCAGAVFFFVGWGTTAGSYTSIADLVTLLGIAMGLLTSFIMNPILKMLFNIGNRKTYMEMTVAQRVMLRLKDVGVSLVIISIISLVYKVINLSAIRMFDLPIEKVFLPAEPIVFGLLYASIFTLGNIILDNVKKKVKKNELHRY